MIEPGAPAPDFTLRDHDGKKVSLSELRGHTVVLAFYPLDFSAVCTDQLSAYQAALPELEASGARLFGISVDSTFCHRAFRERLDLAFPLLADFEPKGEVSRAYGMYVDERGHGARGFVVIDPGGTVKYAHRSPTPLEIPGPELIFEALAT
jgi:peroxiredoxin